DPPASHSASDLLPSNGVHLSLVDTSSITALNAKRCGEIRAYDETTGEIEAGSSNSRGSVFWAEYCN
ncbi:hypothetical protein, partial [uncultured Roseibium sp.]|uniref:hypothetical protein n=1 Tax=uncultured Roseibium sp. TaxID=1936171 RepID=UPI002620FDCC